MEDKCMDTETEGEHRLLYGQDDSSALTNDDAVSLFSTSLTKALEKQNSVIVNSIVQQIAKSSASTPSSSVINGADPQAFEFKHEGNKIQHNFNQERLNKLSEVETLLKEGEIPKAVDLVGEQKAALKQRNKILKIADRHGWDTVHEYLDDPLADDNDDATKLRYAASRAARKRNFRSRPYGQRRGGNVFSPSEFFRGFSNTYGVQGNPQFRPGRQFDAPFALGGPAQQSQRDRVCYYCRQPGHVVRECPFTKAQPVPVPTTAANTKQ